MPNLSETDNYDVVIVGMGPTGLVLANLLGLEKLNVLIIDKFLNPYDLPRAVHLDDEIMRILQVIGVASEMEKIMRPNLGMRFVDADNNLLLDWPRPQEIGKNGWKPSYKFHQPDLERVLYKNLKKFPNVEIRKGFEATEVKNEDEKVEVTILKLEENNACRVKCDFIVGCDGARSFIRKKMGVEYEEMGFFEDWLVVDIILKKDRSDLGLFSIQFCGTSQPATYSPGTRGRLRWEFALKDKKSHEDILKTDYVWNLLSRWITPDEAKIERKAIYTFKSSLAEHWVKDRLILAGDSAHLTPPFMGQGMCIGLRDVSNLAWKLISVIRGQSDLSFLKSYEIERRPHAKEYISTAIKLGKMLGELNSNSKKNKEGPIHMKSLAPKIGNAFSIKEEEFARSLSLQPKLSNGQYVDDIVGYKFCLFLREDLANQFSENNSNIIVFNSKDHPIIKEYLENLSTKALLIRPDKYILGGAKNLTELNELLSLEFINSINNKI